MRRLCALLIFFLLPTAVSSAAERALTLDDVFDPDKKLYLGGAPQSGLLWIDNQSFYWPKRNREGTITAFLVVNAESGKTRELLDIAKFSKSIESVSPAKADAIEKDLRDGKLTFDKRYQRAVFATSGDLYLLDLGRNSARRITTSEAKEEEAEFSPDGRHLAFVRENDLWLLTLQSGSETRLTRDGNAKLLNGKLDYVYQEEVFGRGKFRGFWWSGDSKRIAFLQLDQAKVPEITIVDEIPYRPELKVFHYPKAGDPNPRARMFVADIATAEVRRLDTSRYPEDLIVASVSWTPDSREVMLQIQNREQTWLELAASAADSGRTRTVLRETSAAWVDNVDPPRWLNDGTFLWLSERNGYRHIYRFRRDGTLVRQVTSGAWEVRDIDGADVAGRIVYFTATEKTSREEHLYRVSIDGSQLRRLSSSDATHAIEANPASTRFLDRWSNVSTPPRLSLIDTRGRISHVDENRVEARSTIRMQRPEFITVPNRDGFAMEAMIIRPPGFDRSRRYPTLLAVYGGPNAPIVTNSWGRDEHLFHQLLAQRGVIVVEVDNRSASGKGAVHSRTAYGELGAGELRDLEDAVRWLVANESADPARIAISGWSYGGFMTSYALTHSTLFRAGIAGAPVTDWRDYDSIYTERLLKLPENNPEGYRKSSPRFSAATLHGSLLLIHGTMDDNVHDQNTIQFAYELQKAGKQFEMMLYAKSRHGVTEKPLQKHMRTMMLEFLERELGLAKE